VQSWWAAHTYPTKIAVGPIVWALVLLVLLALLDQSGLGRTAYLVPPFAATLSVLLYLPEQPVAQPVPVIVGSTVAAGLGTLVALVVHGPLPAAQLAGALLWLWPRLGIYHPPALALSMFPLLLHPGPWFAVAVVLPFTLVAVLSHGLLSAKVPTWPRYPRRSDAERRASLTG